MLREVRISFRFLVCVFLAYFALLSTQADAQTAPNFALKVTRSLTSLNGSSNVTEWYYSDIGTFSIPVTVSWQGMNGEQLSDTKELTGFTLYVRSQPDFFTTGGQVRVGRVVQGEMSVSKPFGSNFYSRASAPTVYGVSGWDCQTLFGPDLWTACANSESATTTTNIVSYQDQNAYTAGVPVTGNVTDYPAIPYRQSSAGAALTSHVRMQCDPRYGINTCTIPSVQGSVSSTVSVSATIGTIPAYTLQPGNMPGPTEQFQCGGLNEDSSATPAPQGFLNLATANFLLMLEDPVRTRGFPLRNRIFLNSQVAEPNRPMGNATFTYDMHVFSPSMSGQTRWLVVDGDGKRLDYGTGATPMGAAGNFAVFTETASGFTLSSAGAPEELRSAGNYSYAFDTDGKLLTVTDPAGNVQSLTYTAGKLTSVLDVSSNKELTFGWTDDRITSVTENGGAVTNLGYTAQGRVQSIAVQDAGFGTARSISFTYGGTGLLESFTRDGDAASTYHLVYTTNGSVPLARVWSQGRTVMPIYNVYTGGTPYTRIIVPNQKGGSTVYDLNSNFDVTQVKYPALAGSASGATFTFGYDSNRNLNSWSDGATSRSYEYETNGLLKKITRPDTTYIQYNWAGADLQSVVDSLGTIATLTYANPLLPHVPTSYTDGASNLWTLSRNAYGQLTSLVPPTGAQSGAVALTYDETSASASFGWLTKITDALGNETRFDSFSLKGQVTSASTDPDPGTPVTRVTESSAFDAAGRLRTQTHADGKTITFSYSGRNLAYTDDEALTRTNFTYCVNCDALQSESKPLGHLLKWDTDPDLQQTKFTDARLNYTAYAYGQAKELTAENYPDGSVLSYLYDTAYRVRSLTNARNQESQYGFDSLGRLSTVTYPTTGETGHTITYRADDALLSFTDAAGTTTREYYANRLLKAEVFNYAASGLPAVQRVEYEYYPDNLLKKITWKNGSATTGIWTYTYDAAGRMVSVNSFGQTNSFAYDGEGKLLTQTNANTTTISTSWNDERSWPTSITHKKQGVTFASYALQYDGGANSVGNLTQATELNGDVLSYGYDALYRLTSESRSGAAAYSKSFGYDLAGNFTTLDGSSFATYDAANKISSLSGGSISHDSDGNLLSVTSAAIPATSLTWNTRSNLSSLTSGATAVSFTYDTLGRRVRQMQGTAKRFYIFAGDKLLGEIQGSPQVAYTWGPQGLVSERLFQVQYIAVADVYAAPETLAVSAPVSQADDETALSGYAAESAVAEYAVYAIPTYAITLWYHHGPQGETRYLTDPSGNIADTYRYDGYGIPISATNTYYNPHRYGGKYGYHSNLNPTGVILAGHRWYSPQLRRWMSRDPIAYQGGENLYQYVDDDPIANLDPSGLSPSADEKLSDFVVGFGDAFPFRFFTKPARKLINWINGDGFEDLIVDDTSNYEAGQSSGDFVGGMVCTSAGLRIASEFSRFRMFRFLNQNRYLRLGYGRKGGTYRPRVAVGPNQPNLPGWLRNLKHIDLRIRPIDKIR